MMSIRMVTAVAARVASRDPYPSPVILANVASLQERMVTHGPVR